MTSEAIVTTPAKSSFERQAMLTFLACAIVFLLMQSAYATPVNTAMGEVLCRIVSMVYGNLGRGLATLAVVIIGVGATLGKTSWGLAMTVAVGIAVIFNAHVVVGYLVNNSSFTCF